MFTATTTSVLIVLSKFDVAITLISSAVSSSATTNFPSDEIVVFALEFPSIDHVTVLSVISSDVISAVKSCSSPGFTTTFSDGSTFIILSSIGSSGSIVLTVTTSFFVPSKFETAIT